MSDYPTTSAFHEGLSQHRVGIEQDLWRLECLLSESGTLRTLGEDRTLLPTLVHAARGGAGTFVEIGAADGHFQSNTLFLERCLNWTGILIEANPENYAKLLRSGRDRSALVHSGVCHGDGSKGQTIQITQGGFNFAGDPSAMSRTYKRRYWAAETDRINETVAVPCRSLQSIMRAHGLQHGATFLSLDVEGAEAKVLQTVNPAAFAVAMVEMDGSNGEKDERVRRLLNDAGLRLASAKLKVPLSKVFLRGDADERQSGALSLDGTLSSLPPLGAGFCAVTLDGASDCTRDERGSWAFQKALKGPRHEFGHFSRCWSKCHRCDGCRFLSMSRNLRECSWFRACDLASLSTSVSIGDGKRMQTEYYTLAKPTCAGEGGLSSSDGVCV
tara:strand:- start:2130 stop:3287 length:1158 start_codon:yes stop_codon:yes gene_type:complete